MNKGEFRWTTTAQKSFERLKKKVTKGLVLTLKYFYKAFQDDCDASDTTIREVMIQEGSPITYFSEKLDEDKKKYSVYDHEEFYAIV